MTHAAAPAIAVAVALGLASSSARAEATPRPVPLARARGVVGKIAPGLIADVRRVFGVDAGAVPTVVLDGPAFAAAYQRMAKRPAGRIAGFELRGVVYVKDHVFTVDRTIVAHEVLHALSGRFAREAHARGHENLIEGVTDYLAHKIAPQRARGEAGLPRSAYGGYAAYAAELAAAVGDDVLARCYFERGFLALERAVDAELGAGSVDRGARALDRR